MSDDASVTELRAIRDKRSAECGYNVKELFEPVRQRQVDSGAEHVRCARRRVARGDYAGTEAARRRRCAGR